MRRLLRGVLVVMAALGGLMGGAALLGKLRPTPDRLVQFHLADCAPPCWIGIRPGATTLDAARERLRTAYPESSGYTLRFEWIDVVFRERVEIFRAGSSRRLFEVRLAYVSRDPDPLVDQIVLDFGQETDLAPTTGELIALFNTPLTVDASFVPVLYHDGQYTAALNQVSQGIRLDDPVKWIAFPGYFTRTVARPEEGQRDGPLPEQFRWRGFYSCWAVANSQNQTC